MRTGRQGQAGQGRFRLKEVVPGGLRALRAASRVTVTSPRGRPPTRGPPPPPSSRGQRSRRELGMGHGGDLAAEGTRAGGQALAHSRCAQGRWPLARGLQLSLGRGLWKAKMDCVPRGPASSHPAPAQAPCTLRVTLGKAALRTHTPRPGLLVGVAGGTPPSQTRPQAEQAGPRPPPPAQCWVPGV